MSLLGLRWLLLALFAWGATAALSPLARFDPAVSWQFLVSGCAAAVLLAALHKPAADVLWVWILLGIFVVGYYLQTILVAMYAHDPQALFELNGEWSWVDLKALATGLEVFTGAFVTFALSTTVWLLTIGRSPEPATPAIGDPSRTRVLLLLVVSSALSLMFAAARSWLGIGVLGIEGPQLPFRLHTIIFRSQSQVLPALFLLGAWLTDRPGYRPLWYLALCGALGHSLGLSLLAASKAGVVWFALPLVFLWISSGTFTRARLSLLPATAAGLIVLYPVVRAWRAVRIAADNGIPVDFGTFMADVLAQPPLAMLREVVLQIVVRVSGAAGLWFTLRQAASPADWTRLWREGSEPLMLVFSREVYDVSVAGDFRSPGLAAAFLIVGGAIGSLALWALVPWLVGGGWRLLGRLRTAPVARATVGYQLTSFAMEGTLQLQDVAVALAVALLIEWFYRVYLESRATNAIAPEVAPSVASP